MDFAAIALATSFSISERQKRFAFLQPRIELFQKTSRSNILMDSLELAEDVNDQFD